MENLEIQTKTDSSKECREWINTHASKFVLQLSTMGKRFNYDGLEDPLDEVLDEQGIHTGFGMCEIASAAIEEDLRKEFGDKVKTSIVRLNTPKSNFSHTLTRVTFDDGAAITVDGSHRQIDKNAPSLLIIPTEMENQIFQTRRVISEYFNGVGSQKIRNEVQRGQWRNITTEDFDILVATLTEE